MKTAIDFADNIINNKNLIDANLKYCFVDEFKRPFRFDNAPAKPNNVNDFVDIYKLFESNNILNYKGIGISIQASNICAIDVDHCFSTPFDILSANEKAIKIINLFKKVAYIEFSFSGTGIRILFKNNIIDNYEKKYYIKNSKEGIEYYQPGKSYRYVTITGNYIHNNQINNSPELKNSLNIFLELYMKRESLSIKSNLNDIETKTFDELFIITKRLYLKDHYFQELWFSNAPGSGKDESERDYKIIIYLFTHVTKDCNMIKNIFEKSYFFKTKDYKHIAKWNRNNNQYFYCLYNKLKENEC